MLRAYFDGSVTINPGGIAGYGFVVIDDEFGQMCSESGIVGEGKGMTSNVAEWAALGHLLEWLVIKGLQNEPINIYGDSNMVVKQANKEYKTPKKTTLYYQYYLVAFAWLKKFTNVTISWIPREQNTLADEASTRTVCWMSRPDIS